MKKYLEKLSEKAREGPKALLEFMKELPPEVKATLSVIVSGTMGLSFLYPELLPLIIPSSMIYSLYMAPILKEMVKERKQEKLKEVV